MVACARQGLGIVQDDGLVPPVIRTLLLVIGGALPTAPSLPPWPPGAKGMGWATHLRSEPASEEPGAVMSATRSSAQSMPPPVVLRAKYSSTPRDQQDPGHALQQSRSSQDRRGCRYYREMPVLTGRLPDRPESAGVRLRDYAILAAVQTVFPGLGSRARICGSGSAAPAVPVLHQHHSASTPSTARATGATASRSRGGLECGSHR